MNATRAERSELHSLILARSKTEIQLDGSIEL